MTGTGANSALGCLLEFPAGELNAMALQLGRILHSGGFWDSCLYTGGLGLELSPILQNDLE